MSPDIRVITMEEEMNMDQKMLNDESLEWVIGGIQINNGLKKPEQATNDTGTDADKTPIQQEINQIIKQISVNGD